MAGSLNTAALFIIRSHGQSTNQSLFSLHQVEQQREIPMLEQIKVAISELKLLRIHYDPGIRLIEPHTLGRSSKGYLLLRAYQVEGASASGEHKHWKLFRLDRCRSCDDDGGSFGGPRSDYKRDDKAMKGGIIQEL